jgi:hypothetical protein
LSLGEIGLVMTVPTNQEKPHFKGRGRDAVGEMARRKAGRGRRLLMAGVVAVGLTVVALVMAFPSLAAPIGTSAGVVAVIVPLAQNLWRGGSPSEGSAEEP